MGSSREMSISSIIEPITIIVLTALVFTMNTLSLHEMFLASASSLFLSNPALVLISISLFIIIIVETARVPVDNPETHLELTMVHEAMILEYSGRDLALMELSHAVKQALLMAILINIIFPLGLAIEISAVGLIIAVVAFVLKGALLSAIIGIFESSLAKSRLFLIPNLFMIAFFLSILTIFWEVFK
jgi:formate hydrogenlyase subunit 4